MDDDVLQYVDEVVFQNRELWMAMTFSRDKTQTLKYFQSLGEEYKDAVISTMIVHGIYFGGSE